jgi:hypothetical protein
MKWCFVVFNDLPIRAAFGEFADELDLVIIKSWTGPDTTLSGQVVLRFTSIEKVLDWIRNQFIRLFLSLSHSDDLLNAQNIYKTITLLHIGVLFGIEFHKLTRSNSYQN